MQLKLTGTAVGVGLGYFSGIPALIPLGGFLGWQLAAFLSEKEIDGEKIIYGTPGDNGSYANYKRILPNSIRWSKASVVKQRLSKKKQSFYLNHFRFTDKRIKNHFSFLPSRFAKHLENKELTLGWDEPITAPTICFMFERMRRGEM